MSAMERSVVALDVNTGESLMEIFDPELWEEDDTVDQVTEHAPSVNESNDPDKGIRLMERDIEKLQTEVAQLRSRCICSQLFQSLSQQRFMIRVAPFFTPCSSVNMCNVMQASCCTDKDQVT